MGRDKAMVVVDGEPMAVRVAATLREAGAAEVFCVGGDAGALGGLGLDVRPDARPGEGPLGAVLTAFDAATEDVVAVLSCDLVTPTAAAVGALVEAMSAGAGADAALAVAAGRRQPLHAVYRRTAVPALHATFAAGERSIDRAVGRLVHLVLVPVASVAVHDADRPSDLPSGLG
jgi:molybdopterin-guanine dinucleotide biosynthesis protein A